MIKEKMQFFPYGTSDWYKLRDDPNDKSEHAGEARVSNDDQEAAHEQDEDSVVEGVHGIWCESEAQVVKHGRSREDSPMPTLSITVNFVWSIYLTTSWGLCHPSED